MWWHAQAAAYAKLTNDSIMLDSCTMRVKEKLLPSQMAVDGSFPLELERTKPYSYSIFNLNALVVLAWILDGTGRNIWTFVTSDGKGIKKGIDFLFPYVKDKSLWPFGKDISHWEEQPGKPVFLLLASFAYNDAKYLDLWAFLDKNRKKDYSRPSGTLKNSIIWLGLKVPNAN